MKHLAKKQYLIRHNLLSLIGLCLCVYFSWHMALGERSYFKYKELQKEIHVVSLQHDTLVSQRMSLEHKVISMRPTSLDPDLLEERVRVVLGYIGVGEKVLMGRSAEI